MPVIHFFSFKLSSELPLFFLIKYCTIELLKRANIILLYVYNDIKYIWISNIHIVFSGLLLLDKYIDIKNIIWQI